MELESEAVPFYMRALELGLAEEERLGAYLGLGSTLRALGRYAEAKQVLDEAILDFPKRRELQVFLAMVHFNQQAYSEAMEILLKQLAETSNDPGIQGYKKAILFYSDKLDQIWE